MKAKNPFKVMQECLTFAVSKDGTRGNIFETIYHCPDTRKLASTNGHVMTLLGRHFYDEELAGKSINTKTYKTNPREFPQVATFDVTETHHKLASQIFTTIKQHVVKTSPKATLIALYTDGTLSFDVIPGKERIATINSAFLKPLIGTTLDVFYKDGTSCLTPLYFSLNSQSRDSWFVVMPMRDDRFEGITAKPVSEETQHVEEN